MVTLLCVTGCESGSREPSPQDASSPTAPSSGGAVELHSFEDRCSNSAPDARPFAVKSSSGQELYAIEAGTGTRALVLVHGSGARGLCNWAAEVPWLAAAGFRVLAFDAACVGASTCAAGVTRPIDDVIAVVAEAKRRGATDVVVVAASAGGALAVQVAARTDAGVRATVALSPAGLATDWDEPDAAAERTIDAAAVAVVPIMYALAADDSATTVADISALQRASRSAGAIFEKLPAGSGHAQETLYDESGEAPRCSGPRFSPSSSE